MIRHKLIYQLCVHTGNCSRAYIALEISPRASSRERRATCLHTGVSGPTAKYYTARVGPLYMMHVRKEALSPVGSVT